MALIEHGQVALARRRRERREELRNVAHNAEADLVDPDRVAGEGAAADAETEALLREAAARAQGQAREMASAGEVGR
jgi:hypothetical protein